MQWTNENDLTPQKEVLTVCTRYVVSNNLHPKSTMTAYELEGGGGYRSELCYSDESHLSIHSTQRSFLCCPTHYSLLYESSNRSIQGLTPETKTQMPHEAQVQISLQRTNSRNAYHEVYQAKERTHYTSGEHWLRQERTIQNNLFVIIAPASHIHLLLCCVRAVPDHPPQIYESYEIASASH